MPPPWPFLSSPTHLGVLDNDLFLVVVGKTQAIVAQAGGRAESMRWKELGTRELPVANHIIYNLVICTETPTGAKWQFVDPRCLKHMATIKI